MDGAARALGRSSVDSATRTFNEGEEVVKPSGRTETRQWTIDPKDGQPRGFAFVWRRFEISDLPVPMLACVMATVPANALISRTIKSQEEYPRMPAILDDDAWSTWLGEDGATPVAAKALLKTMEGVNWQAAPEPKKPRPRNLERRELRRWQGRLSNA
jgi:putative SOS response-associated peptidase YedK